MYRQRPLPYIVQQYFKHLVYHLYYVFYWSDYQIGFTHCPYIWDWDFIFSVFTILLINLTKFFSLRMAYHYI